MSDMSKNNMIQQDPYEAHKQRYVAGNIKDSENIITKTYYGGHDEAIRHYQKNAQEFAQKGYFPTNQVWVPGSYGCASFILALLSCILLIGFLIFIYMIIVKPPGKLTVTYEFRKIDNKENLSSNNDNKICPQCAETIKYAAKICRYCRYEFSDNINIKTVLDIDNEVSSDKLNDNSLKIISKTEIEKKNRIVNQSKEFIEKDEFKNAVIAYSKAIEIDRNDGKLYYLRSIAYMKLKDKKKMLVDLNISADLGYSKAIQLLKRKVRK